MKPSPEERLLQLIRGKPSPAAAGASSKPSAAAGAPTRARGGHARLRWSTAAAIGLGVLLVAELGYLANQLSHPVSVIQVPPVPAPLPVRTAEPPAALSDVPSLAAAMSRPLFAVSLSGPVRPEARGPTGPTPMAKGLAARLTLMGIVAGDPAQAIIEDAETKKTFFVSIGQPVVEGAVVEQVLENRVVLDLAGEKIELTL